MSMERMYVKAEREMILKQIASMRVERDEIDRGNRAAMTAKQKVKEEEKRNKEDEIIAREEANEIQLKTMQLEKDRVMKTYQ
jgi:tRNA(Glu) U13 pseudouridine synthase TruD